MGIQQSALNETNSLQDLIENTKIKIDLKIEEQANATNELEKEVEDISTVFKANIGKLETDLYFLNVDFASDLTDFEKENIDECAKLKMWIRGAAQTKKKEIRKSRRNWGEQENQDHRARARWSCFCFVFIFM